MGETANPGNAFNAEMENIPIKVMRGIVPCPVCFHTCSNLLYEIHNKAKDVWFKATYRLFLYFPFQNIMPGSVKVYAYVNFLNAVYQITYP